MTVQRQLLDDCHRRRYLQSVFNSLTILVVAVLLILDVGYPNDTVDP